MCALDVVRQLDPTLARVPAALQARFVERTAEVLESMARFDQAEALRNPSDKPKRKRAKRKD